MICVLPYHQGQAYSLDVTLTDGCGWQCGSGLKLVPVAHGVIWMKAVPVDES